MIFAVFVEIYNNTISGKCCSILGKNFRPDLAKVTVSVVAFMQRPILIICGSFQHI